MIVFYAAIPIVAVAAAGAMNELGNPLLMYLFVILVVAAVLLLPTRFVSSNLYPATVFLIALGTFLHRNLLTSGVVGADIQLQYFIAQRIIETQAWSPIASGPLMALPMVSSVPAIISIFTGLSVATVFKVVYVGVFSLVPVGIYFVGRKVFGTNEGLFGSLFFVFYHGTFYFTPGKQLFSEVFLILLVLLFVTGRLSTSGGKVAGLLFTVGLIHSHYGSTYVLGGSLLAGFLLLTVVSLIVDDFDHELSLAYPVAVLTLGTVWYSITTTALVESIAQIPLSIIQQVATLLQDPVVGSGASYVQQQMGVLRVLNVLVYLTLTALLGLGLVWRVGKNAADIRRDGRTIYPEYTAVAIPMFLFLAASFVIIANLWADRVYQMVLVFLAPLAALGFHFLFVVFGSVLKRLGSSIHPRPLWALFAVVLSVLLVLNSGAAFAAAGDANTSTFDSSSNDYSFTDEERAGAFWLKQHVGFSDEGAYRPGAVESESTVTVYTDSVTYQLFRSVMPEDYYDVRVERLRSPWEPEFDESRLEEGYVFIRKRSIAEDSSGEVLPISQLSPEDVSAITDSGTIIFENEDVTIVEIDQRPGE
ncbi:MULTISPECIES: DUF2206 domain-containing protein [Haloferax]|uniref:DUF2206 domain-containing protein n=1 Tax=Haloferax TaxID=2251 RepID=UPI00177ADE4F|nr:MULTISPECIES: DUF2206 domain-containing protein [Haloferax]